MAAQCLPLRLPVDAALPAIYCAMTAHELARKLLELPDLPVVVHDGSDPSDLMEANCAQGEAQFVFLNDVPYGIHDCVVISPGV
jgi:hypothetical protein